MSDLIGIPRSVIPACDVPFEVFKQVVRETAGIAKVGAYKVGVSFLDVGLNAVVEAARQFTDKPIIYDHQKAGTDIHDTADTFMDGIVRAGVSAVILFPMSGPITEYEWIKAAKARGVGVIVGGEMTHPRFLEGDLSEGKKKAYQLIFEILGLERNLTGFIRSTAPEEIYELAARMGVTDFVVPGNKPDRIRHYKSLVERCGVAAPTFYSPGLVTQGGDIKEGARAAGDRWHAIVGRDIYNKNDMRAAAEMLTEQL